MPSPESAAARVYDDRPLLGVATLVAALAILPGMDAIAKLLAGHLPILEIVWARYLVYALFLLPLTLRRHGVALFRPTRPLLQLLRGGLMAFSAVMFFSAVARTPLADAMAVFFVYPLLILLASAVVLREPSAGCAGRWSSWASSVRPSSPIPACMRLDEACQPVSC